MSEPNLPLHQWFVSLGVAITLIASFLGYGTLIRRALRLPLPFIPVLGSAFASLIMAALGGGGLIHSLCG